jgi:hypothetical protein
MPSGFSTSHGYANSLDLSAPATFPGIVTARCGGYLLVIQSTLAGLAPAELEYGLVAREQFADVAGCSSSYLVAGALGLNV